MDAVLDLARISNSINPFFKEFISHPNVFDYFGLERGGHYAVARWLLESGPSPYGIVSGAHRERPVLAWGSLNGWHTTVGKPVAGALTYGPDAPLNGPSRLASPRAIVCVRDIRNMLASRQRWNEARYHSFHVNIPAVERWREYAMQALGDSDHFKGQCVPIVFDRWATSIEYRAEVIERLNDLFGWTLRSNEAALEKVSPAAGGSSFQGMDMDGQAHAMDVTQRWKYIQNDLHIQSLLTPEVLDLNKRLTHAATL